MTHVLWDIKCLQPLHLDQSVHLAVVLGIHYMFQLKQIVVEWKVLKQLQQLIILPNINILLSGRMGH